MNSDHEQKRHKKSKRKHRHDEEDTTDKMDMDEVPEDTEATKKDKKEKKKKSKDKKRKGRADDAGAETEAAIAEPTASPEKKHKRHKSGDQKERKHKKKDGASSPAPPPAESSQAAVVPDNKQYPFFVQTFSQRIPVWPAAFDEPLSKTAREYLDPMLNRYSPRFKGVLLAYKNVSLSERPRRPDPRDLPTDDTPVVLASLECYAPPFAWLTADLHLFVPSRGAWMEGVINLQSEGHIGVVCFEKFNASIMRSRLPKGWKWVEREEEEDPFGDEAREGEGEANGEDGDAGEGEDGANKEAQATPRLRSTGYWVDANGDKVDGKIYFRIKNFSSGSTGDYTYLSLQGTMLDDEAEKKAAAEEQAAEKARRARQNPNGLLYPTMRLPESSMTKLKEVDF